MLKLDISSNELIYTLVSQLSKEQLIELIVDLDVGVADLEFSKELISALTDSLNADEGGL